MSQDNAVRKPIAAPDPRRSLHLVYSRAEGALPAGPVAVAAHKPGRQAMETILFAVETLRAPLVWAGRAILAWFA